MRIDRNRGYRIHEVCHLFGDCHRTTVWRMVKRGQLSPPVKVSEKLTVFPGDQLADDLEAMRTREVA